MYQSKIQLKKCYQRLKQKRTLFILIKILRVKVSDVKKIYITVVAETVVVVAAVVVAAVVVVVHVVVHHRQVVAEWVDLGQLE